MPEKISHKLFEISKNLEAIAIIDFIPNDKLEEFDQNFFKFFGYKISIEEIPKEPGIPIEYSSGIYHLSRDKGIPEGLSDIQLIQIKHIGGVAEEIICYCKIDKEIFEQLFDKSYEKSFKNHIYSLASAQIKDNVDGSNAKIQIEKALESIDLTEKYNLEKEFVFDFRELATFLRETTIRWKGEVTQGVYFNAKLYFIEGLQKRIEEFFQDLIPGVYLSKKEKCLSAWIYDLSHSDFDIVKKAKEKSLSIKDVNEWKSKFEYSSRFFDEESEDRGTHLSLIGWTIIDETYEFVSLLGQSFIISYGMGYKDSYLGNYKTNYIILKLKKADIEYWIMEGLKTESALTNLSKFLFPAEWIKHMYFLLLDLDKSLRVPLDQRNPSILEYKNDLNKLSSELGIWIRSLDDAYRKKVKVSEISENLRYLESLIASNTSFLKEVKSERCKPLSEYLLEDSKSWIIKIKKKIRDVSEMQSSGIQYHNDTINTLNSLINIKYQGKLENLTNWLLGLTIVLVILTSLLAKPELSEFYRYILAYGKASPFP
jgi:hypothetical protein